MLNVVKLSLEFAINAGKSLCLSILNFNGGILVTTSDNSVTKTRKVGQKHFVNSSLLRLQLKN